MTRVRRRAGIVGVLLTIAVFMALAGTAAAERTAPVSHEQAAAVPPGQTVTLPDPTGGYPVGTTRLHLVDEAREDPWKPGTARELMVTLWYPALLPFGERAPYMSPAESATLIEGRQVELPPGVPDTVAGSVRTHAFVHDPPIPARRHWPLVILSPGFSLPRASLTALAEELASRGFIVVGIDHTYEAFGVEFPDGRVATCLVCEAADGDTFQKVIEGRAADVSFVLDELTGRHPAWRGGRFIDPSRIGMAGHSIGGASTLQTMLADPRIDAGIDLDGTLFLPPSSELHRPFMLLGSDRPDDDSWTRAWPKLTGWKRWLRMEGSNHGSFTDFPLILDQLGVAGASPGIPADRALDITRTYVVAFFDEHLRHRPGHLLDGPSSHYPEVTFVR